jgi:choline dehydrogenase
MPAVMPGLRHDRPNLTIMTDTAVSHLQTEGNRVSGVRVVRRGTTVTIRTEREVIVCAGAIGSPKLLLLSGIGPAQELESLGVAVRLAHPHVGRNLQNHVAYRLEYSTNAPVTARRYVDPRRGSIEILRYALSGTGILGAGAAPIGGFLRSTSDAPEPDVQLFAIPALMGRGRGFWGMLPERHGYTLCINQGTPYSRGSVFLASSDHREAPRIDPGYFSDERDLHATVAAAQRMRAVAHAPSLARWTDQELFPGAAVTSRADWIRHVRANAGNHYHVSGTCRMGRTIEDSVTDPRLRVHGINGLRVADASVMPVLMNGNTNAAVAMIAERAAGLIAEDA